jgi:hypothetical protein
MNDLTHKAELAQWLRTPPPRRLPDHLRKELGKIPRSWTLVLFGFVFFAIGSVFCAVFLPWQMLQELSLDRASRSTMDGIVTKTETTNMSINRAKVWRNEVTFRDGDQEIVSVGYTTGKDFREGDRVKVRVHPDDLDLHCPQNMRMSKGSVGSAFVLIFPLLGFFVMISPWITRRSRLKLYENGTVSDIQVSDIKATNIQINHRTVHKVSVKYPMMANPIEVKITDFDDLERLMEARDKGHALSVLYRPQKPKRFIIL